MQLHGKQSIFPVYSLCQCSQTTDTKVIYLSGKNLDLPDEVVKEGLGSSSSQWHSSIRLCGSIITGESDSR